MRHGLVATAFLGLSSCAVFALGTAAADSTARAKLPVPRTNVRPLQTAIEDSLSYIRPDAETAFAHTKAAGASFARIGFGWKYIVPSRYSATVPTGFNTTDPNDPGYDWVSIDNQVRYAVANGLEPIATVYAAPVWGLKDGLPDPAKVADFALAAARRFNGNTKGIPRVRYWEAWNEPNHVGAARLKKGAGAWYRTLANRFSAAVDSVHKDNVVIAGVTAPFETQTSVAPLKFMREALCIAGGERPHATCSGTMRFDIWAHHPYTSGGPTREARGGDDVSMGDLPQMKRLLETAIRVRHVISTRPVDFWVTEFGWDSNPPDPKGVPIALETRWVAEGLYRMWAAGVSMATWFKIRDEPIRTNFNQSGLYSRGSTIARDRPKPTLYAFRFPFVAFKDGNRVFVWGRTPAGRRGQAQIEQSVSGTWRTLGRLRTDRYGIFSHVYTTAAAGPLRARFGSETAVPFSLTVPPDHYYPPFGS